MSAPNHASYIYSVEKWLLLCCTSDLFSFVKSEQMPGGGACTRYEYYRT
jgi:hypothetical protein